MTLPPYSTLTYSLSNKDDTTACFQLGCRGSLPDDPVPEGSLEDEGFLKQFHHALLEVRKGISGGASLILGWHAP